MATAPGVDQAPIVVTGMARSGTSWVGKLLEASGELTYINGAAQPRPPAGALARRARRLGRLPLPVHRRGRQGRLAGRVRRDPAPALPRRSRAPAQPLALRPGQDGHVRDQLPGRAPAQARALLDDPYALLASEWLAERLGCRVVVVVRDPAAMVASWRRLGWTTDLGELLDQPALMRDWLEPFRAEMEGVAATPGDQVGRVAMLWRLLHLVAAEYERRCPAVRIVRYEDLAADPVPSFAGLYAALGLSFDRRAEAEVVRSTTGSAHRTAHRWSLSRNGISKTGFRPWTAGPTWPPGGVSSAPTRSKGPSAHRGRGGQVVPAAGLTAPSDSGVRSK